MKSYSLVQQELFRLPLLFTHSLSLVLSISLPQSLLVCDCLSHTHTLSLSLPVSRSLSLSLCLFLSLSLPLSHSPPLSLPLSLFLFLSLAAFSTIFSSVVRRALDASLPVVDSSPPYAGKRSSRQSSRAPVTALVSRLSSDPWVSGTRFARVRKFGFVC